MRRLGLAEWVAMAGPITSGRFVRYSDAPGPGQIDRFEAQLAETMGVRHTLTMTNGTAALVSILAAAGIGPGDEVIVPTFTWVATAIAPLAVGAVPVLADIDETMTLDPTDLPRRLSPHTKAIIVVHMANAVCNMEAVNAFAQKHGLMVFEDACQAVGVQYKGRYCGTLSQAGAFSFNAYKNLSSGEGGAVLTNDTQLFTRARTYHDCGDYGRGSDSDKEPAFVGFNFKAHEMQGAVLNVQLRKLGPYIEGLKRRRAMLAAMLADRPDCTISPHHDPAAGCNLSLLFETEEAAIAFAQHRGVARLKDSGKHLFTNWQSILNKRTAHPKLNPWAWAHRDIDYSASRYLRTLDILSRTCRVELGGRWPLPVVYAYGRWLKERLSVARIAPLSPGSGPGGGGLGDKS